MQMTDTLTLDGVRKTADGYLVADVRAARTGIQIYTGAEVGKPEVASVRVYRPEAEVFSKDSLSTYAYRPVTLDHPEMVNADNWRDVAVGQTGGEVARDGEFVRVPMVVMDASAIRAIEAGKRQLSMGYTTDLKFEDGKTPAGEPYDAIQTNLRMNHLAVVALARGGSELRVGDDSEKEMIMADAIQTKTVIVDGLSVITTDQGAQAIDKLQKQLADANAASAKATTDHDKAIAARDAEIAKKDAEIDSLKGKIVDGAALDKLVAARASLIATAKAIAKDVKTDGLSDAEIRKATVSAALGDAAVKDKTEAYIDARFDILAEDAAKKSPDAFRDAIRNGNPPANDAAAASTAHKAYTDHLTSAWQNRKEA